MPHFDQIYAFTQNRIAMLMQCNDISEFGIVCSLYVV